LYISAAIDGFRLFLSRQRDTSIAKQWKCHERVSGTFDAVSTNTKLGARLQMGNGKTGAFVWHSGFERDFNLHKR
jgi:hypothetical protein